MLKVTALVSALAAPGELKLPEAPPQTFSVATTERVPGTRPPLLLDLGELNTVPSFGANAAKSAFLVKADPPQGGGTDPATAAKAKFDAAAAELEALTKPKELKKGDTPPSAEEKAKEEKLCGLAKGVVDGYVKIAPLQSADMNLFKGIEVAQQNLQNAMKSGDPDAIKGARAAYDNVVKARQNAQKNLADANTELRTAITTIKKEAPDFYKAKVQPAIRAYGLARDEYLKAGGEPGK